MTLDIHSTTDTTVTTTTRTLRGRVGYLLLAAVATIRARQMLAEALKPYRTRGSPDIPPHILRDIGLPADYQQDGKKYWDHQ